MCIFVNLSAKKTALFSPRIRLFFAERVTFHYVGLLRGCVVSVEHSRLYSTTLFMTSFLAKKKGTLGTYDFHHFYLSKPHKSPFRRVHPFAVYTFPILLTHFILKRTNRQHSGQMSQNIQN